MTTLERLRREQGLDQKDLAARAGVAQSTVSRAESGGKLTTQTALALARVLKVSVEDLFGGESPADSDPVEVLHVAGTAAVEGAA